jgi:hypothetical protein
MKLAEVAAGGSFSVEDAIALRDHKAKSPTSPEEETDGIVMKIHKEKSEKDSVAAEQVMAPSETDSAQATPNENYDSNEKSREPSLHSSASNSSVGKVSKADPVVDVCPDLQVKIADLGNACWLVSFFRSNIH